MVLTGDSSVGKSCIMKMMSEGEFEKKFQYTIGVDFNIVRRTRKLYRPNEEEEEEFEA
jgi:GTPase SAR1 family protein